MSKNVMKTPGRAPYLNSTRITQKKIGGNVIQFQTSRIRSFSMFKDRVHKEAPGKYMEAPANPMKQVMRVLIYDGRLLSRLSDPDISAIKSFLKNNSRLGEGRIAEVHVSFKNVSTAAYVHLNEEFNIFPRSKDQIIVVTLK